jgi:hypothetical protein
VLAHALRGIVASANQPLGETPESVEVTFRRTGTRAGFFCSGRCWFWPGFPMRERSPRPRLNRRCRRALMPIKTTLIPVGVPVRTKRGWLVLVAILAAFAGIAAGIVATLVPRAARTPDSTESGTVSGSSASTRPTTAPGVEFPTSEPLAADQFVVPRGRNDATVLYLASVSGVVAPHRLASTSIRGRNSWPMLSADRRTIIYINYVAGTLRTMAADGSGDRALITSPHSRCGQITRASWSPADQSIMVVECRTQGRPDRLLVINLDGEWYASWRQASRVSRIR